VAYTVGTHILADFLMSNGSGPAVFQERRRATRVYDAVALEIVPLKNQPAAGEEASPANTSNTAAEPPLAPSC